MAFKLADSYYRKNEFVGGFLSRTVQNEMNNHLLWSLDLNFGVVYSGLLRFLASLSSMWPLGKV
jgi:hypothetical protein